MQEHNGETRQISGNGTALAGSNSAQPAASDCAAGKKPVARSEQIASRRDRPSPQGIGALAWAAANDVILGNIEVRQATSMARSLQVVIATARNRDAIQDLCTAICAEEEQAELARQARIAELRRELESLEQ